MRTNGNTMHTVHSRFVRTAALTVISLVAAAGFVASPPAKAQPAANPVDIDWVVRDTWQRDGLGDDVGISAVITLTDTRGCDPQGVRWEYEGLTQTTPGSVLEIYTTKEKVVDVKAVLLSRNETWGRTIILQQYVIAVLGDSNASGEGNPRQGGSWGLKRCHRSEKSGHAQAAQRVEDDGTDSTRFDARSSVIMVHLGCSGASMSRGGTTLAYDGVEPDEGVQAPQLRELARVAAGREIDAVLLSIGVNDLGDKGFGNIVSGCLSNLTGSCDVADSTGTNARAQVDRNLPKLKSLYQKLNDKLQPNAIDAKRVFITEYPDPSQNIFGLPCRIDTVGFILAITVEEMRGLGKTSADLNTEVRSSAQAHGWNYVGGIYDKFKKRGYCSPDSAIVKIIDSALDQLDTDGSFHPNSKGHAITREAILAKLIPALQTNDLPRAPGGAAVKWPQTVRLDLVSAPTTTTKKPGATTTKKPIATTTAPKVPTTTAAPTTTTARAGSATTTTPPAVTTTTTTVPSDPTPPPPPSDPRGPITPVCPSGSTGTITLTAPRWAADVFPPFQTPSGARPRVAGIITLPYDAAYPLSSLPYPSKERQGYKVTVDGFTIPDAQGRNQILFNGRSWSAASDASIRGDELYLLVLDADNVPKQIVVTGLPGCGATLVYDVGPPSATPQ
jgi:lysophospholipase L1-like esterase